VLYAARAKMGQVEKEYAGQRKGPYFCDRNYRVPISRNIKNWFSVEEFMPSNDNYVLTGAAFIYKEFPRRGNPEEAGSSLAIRYYVISRIQIFSCLTVCRQLIMISRNFWNSIDYELVK
jgi:hypothetical protein